MKLSPGIDNAHSPAKEGHVFAVTWLAITAKQMNIVIR